MSLTWTRAYGPMLCGACGGVLKRGDPIQEMRVTGLKRVAIRCRKCAQGDVPPDLPPIIEKASVSDLAPMVPARVLAKGAALPLDYKLRQFADRDPGEEG